MHLVSGQTNMCFQSSAIFRLITNSWEICRRRKKVVFAISDLFVFKSHSTVLEATGSKGNVCSRKTGENTSLQAVHSIRTFCLCSTETVDDDNTEKDFRQNMNIHQKRIKLTLTRDGDAIERQAVCSYASCLVNSFAKWKCNQLEIKTILKRSDSKREHRMIFWGFVNKVSLFNLCNRLFRR